MLGKGTFGIVTASGDDAVKQFKSINRLIEEVFVTVYVSNCKHAIKLRECDFEALTMTTQRWNCSLEQVLSRESLTLQQKVAIHKCIIKALVELEHVYILHSDLKPSNVLVNSNRTKAVLVDFGLASIAHRAKTDSTAPGYADKFAKRHRTHDMFGLAITSMQLFVGYRPHRQLNKSQLRTELIKYVRDDRLRVCLLNTVQEDLVASWNAEKLLYELYNEYYSVPAIEKPKIFYSKVEEINLQVFGEVKRLCYDHTIRRSQRCYQCSISLVSRLHCTPQQLLLYVHVMVMIFGATFGSHGIKMEVIQAKLNVSTKQIHHCLATIVACSDVVKLMFAP